MYIKIKVFPKSKKEELIKLAENKFEIKVKEKAERNLANNRVIELLASHFDLAKEKVKIINGHRSPSKLLSIDIE